MSILQARGVDTIPRLVFHERTFCPVIEQTTRGTTPAVCAVPALHQPISVARPYLERGRKPQLTNLSYTAVRCTAQSEVSRIESTARGNRTCLSGARFGEAQRKVARACGGVHRGEAAGARAGVDDPVGRRKFEDQRSVAFRLKPA